MTEQNANMIFILSITIPLTLNPTLCFFCCEVFYSVSVADARYLEQRPVFECGVTEHVFLLAFILKDITLHPKDETSRVSVPTKWPENTEKNELIPHHDPTIWVFPKNRGNPKTDGL